MGGRKVKEFINQFGEGSLVAVILGILIAFNLFMSGLSKAIESFMNKTQWEGDNKAHALIQKILRATQAVADWLTGNRPH